MVRTIYIIQYHTDILNVLPFQIHSAQGFNLGLFAGDTLRRCGPIIIENSRKAPVVINIHSKPLTSSLPRPNLTSKPPPLKLSEPIRLPSPLSKSLFSWSAFMSPLFPKLPLVPLSLKRVPTYVPTLPLIPKIPILPAPTLPSLLPKHSLLPPLPPPIIAPFYPLPYTLLPFIPQFTHAPMKSLKPFKIPFLGKRALLQKALGSEIKTVSVPYMIVKKKPKILEKLSELKNT